MLTSWPRWRPRKSANLFPFVCRAGGSPSRPANEKERSMEPLLRMVNINKTFGERTARHDVTFEVGRNEVGGRLGDNGAGKSRVIEIVTGYSEPEHGGE